MFLNVNESLDFPCKNDSYRVKFHAGIYKIECWGASGGDSDIYKGGRGGYVSGTIYFKSNMILYIYPGAQGRTNQLPSFNGGGQGDYHNHILLPSGGGGSDVRIKANDLNSRIIVAGGGGAAIYYPGAYQGDGGDAGGLNGYPGIPSGSNANNSRPPYVGTQTGSGDGGSFGKGGSEVYAGGGGGYFGGGHSFSVINSISSASGGSSYISGHDGCVWINKITSFSDNELYFTDSIMKDGQQSFLSPSGHNEIGHTGDGFVRITLFERRTSKILTKNLEKYIFENLLFTVLIFIIF